MAINRIEIKDFLAFRGDFVCDFCDGVNVVIGGNGTGKTTLLKVMYMLVSQPAKKFNDLNQGKAYCGALEDFSCLSEISPMITENTRISINNNHIIISGDGTEQNCISCIRQDKNGTDTAVNHNYREMKKTASYQISYAETAAYIPEKDILEHAKGLLTFIEQKQTGFSQIYKDVLVNGMDVPTQKQSQTQITVGKMISEIIGGTVQWDRDNGSFYTSRTDGTRIPFANEASGYKKLGYLGLLITSGQLESDSVLLWDEPENSLNPEFVSVLVRILLELQRNGVQIFLATHSEIFASYFSVLKNKGDNVMFYSLYKDGGQIKCDTNDRFDLLNPNNLTEEPVKLYEKKLDKGLGNG